jgi:hypothetical protein
MLAMLAQPVPGDNKALTMRDPVSITKMQYFAGRRYQSLHHQKIFADARILLRFPALFICTATGSCSRERELMNLRGSMMLIPKNVGPKERVVRIVAGVAMMLCGLVGLGVTPLDIAVAAVGGASVVSGLIRYCPACAIAGKRGAGNCRDGA